MNKVVLLSDKEQLSKGAFDFACMLNEQSPILLSGVFLPEVDYWNALYYYSYGMGVPAPFYPLSDVLVAQEASIQFRRLCELNGIDYRVREKQYENIKEELRLETRFADLLIFSNEAFYNHLDAVMSGEYTEEALHHSECAVVILPETFKRPDKIILGYDGSASSVYAIKQFAHLLPEFAKLETLLVYVNPHPDKALPDLDYMEELAARHFPNLSIMKLDIDPKEYFSTWLANVKNTMLVAGAKGRGGLSELFRRSFISEIVREHTIPVFSAHN